jgi:hypothetical protein
MGPFNNDCDRIGKQFLMKIIGKDLLKLRVVELTYGGISPTMFEFSILLTSRTCTAAAMNQPIYTRSFWQ